MIKHTLVACLLILLSVSGAAQTSAATLRIKYYIKAWGFLKYHHPSVATGSPDWDNIFIKNVNQVMQAGSFNGYNAAISALIESAGNAPEAKPRNKPDSLFLMNQQNINWARSTSLFNNDVKMKLQYISNNQHQDTNRYIRMLYNTANFDGENKFEEMPFPDTQHRLLFLSRFWNIINYFAPYKYLTTSWDDVLTTFIPKVIVAKNAPDYYRTLQQLCRSLNDGHSQLALSGQMLSDVFFGNYTVPFYCTIIGKDVVVRNVANDSISREVNIRRGDVVLKIDGEAISSLIARRKKYISASNQADEQHQLGRYILDGQTPEAVLEVKRDNKIFKTRVTRKTTQNRDWGAFINYTYNDVGYKKLPDSILLIYAMQIWDGNIDTIKHLIRTSKAVIFDVRNYPQNDAFFSIADPFLAEPKTIDQTTVALPQFPGLFKWTPNQNKIGHFSDSAYTGKVLILCDERTQSQGEYSCMVLQTIPGAVTIGSQTAGADGIVTNIPMGNGLTISYSGYGVYYPDKTPTQRTGIRINIQVKKTVEAIKSNTDEILDRALQYLKNGH